MSNQFRRKGLPIALALFAAGLLLSWVTHGTGVVHDDPKRNISIPKQLTVPLQVQAAYNDTNMFFRYRWPAEKPHIFHDVVTFEDGNWVRKGKGNPGPEPDGMHEDRVAMMLDDGSVPEFARYGGYLAIGSGIDTFTKHASADEVKAHPYLGKKLKSDVVSKSLPETRTDINDWASVQPEETLKAQRAAGYFLDLWHWRGHRSNPIDMSDDQVIAEARLGDEGKSSAGSNWDGDKKQPKLMFNAATTGYKALKWDDIQQGKISQDSTYFLREGEAVPFDPTAGWVNGDTLPRRTLRTPEGSHADIAVQGKGRWADGFWDVTLTRKLDTGHPLDDKILKDQGAYAVAFAIHRNATGGRWHYISLPASLGLGRSGDIVAQRFAGDAPTWGDKWSDVELFYPGQVDWPSLNSTKHAGAKFIRQGQPVTTHHSVGQLKQYGIEAEFADEIRRQWLMTLFAGLLLIAGFGFALNQLLKRKQGV
ncbi:MAG: ethylbenzene dehydrogenase-related protein [Burkholderiaceae bacterium]